MWFSRINLNGLCDLKGNAYRMERDFYKGHPGSMDFRIPTGMVVFLFCGGHESFALPI